MQLRFLSFSCMGSPVFRGGGQIEKGGNCLPILSFPGGQTTLDLQDKITDRPLKPMFTSCAKI